MNERCNDARPASPGPAARRKMPIP